MNLDTLLSKLQGVKRYRKSITARCPAHEDMHNSLSVSEAKDGKILLHCHANCTTEAIVGALGLEMRDLFPAKDDANTPEIVATYNYADETGKTLFQTVRFEPKTFRQRRKGASGEWIWNLDGVRRVLFRLPELLAADPSSPVFIIEGEKDVNTLERLGVVATTNPMGAGKWLDEYSPCLKGRQVVILPDNDDVGRAHGDQVACSVLPYAASVKIIALPDLPIKGDASDWIERGGTRADLLDLADRAPLFQVETDQKPLRLLSADQILQTVWGEPKWAVPNLLPVGLCILAGAPKLGKSWLGLQLAQAVASGGFALGEQVERGAVLYLALEDTARRLQDRMVKQGWELGLPADFMTIGQYAKEIQDLTNGGGERLARQITERGYRLVIIDTLARSIHGDQNDVAVMTRALAPLQEIAHLNDCAILLIDHHRKPGAIASDVIGDILGSTAKGAMCDTAWGLYRERGKEGARLAVTGRDVSEQNLALKMDWQRFFWSAEGDADELNMTERRQEILEALREVDKATLSQISQTVNQDRSNTDKRLKDMVSVGMVKREGKWYSLP